MKIAREVAGRRDQRFLHRNSPAVFGWTRGGGYRTVVDSCDLFLPRSKLGAVTIRPVQPGDETEALRMRRALLPECTEKEHITEIGEYVSGRRDSAMLVAERPGVGLRGFAEVGLRSYAEGCWVASPVGYLEGWWVDADQRRTGVGSALLDAAEAWARDAGCVEMGSDALLGNELSRTAHLALGFEEVERAVHFRKALSESAPTRIRRAASPPRPTALLRRGKLGSDIPADLPLELVTPLVAGADVRVERIVSRGHVSPAGFWYEQEEDEWVLLIVGAARIEFEDFCEVSLVAGDWLDIQRRVRHRVSWTDPDRDTIWLAVFRR